MGKVNKMARAKKNKDYVDRITFPEWCWHNTMECVVRVLNRGHFPDTAMVQLPDDRVIETSMNDLRDKDGR